MKLADYSQLVTADQLDAALRAGAFEGVFHYLGGNFARRVEDQVVVANVRSKGWPQAGIFVPTLASVDGAGDGARAQATYAMPPGSRLYLDVEPVEFDQDPAGWAAAADRWCDAIRAAGYSPGVYGVDRTVAACGNHAASIWRAVPGECDPAGPGLAASFFAGRRIIQCGSGVWAGVKFDVSYSQFDIGGTDVLDPKDPVIVALQQDIANVQAQANDNRLVLGILYNLLVWGRTHAPTGGPDAVPDVPEVEETTLTALQQAVANLPGGQAQFEPVLAAIAQVGDAVGRIENGLKGA